MRVTRIRVEDFRCIGRVDCELSPLTVVIGPNAVGKSSLLDAIHFFAPLHTGVPFNTALAPQGGFPANRRYQAPQNRPIKFGITASVTDVAMQDLAMHYDVSLRGEGPTGCFIESETLRMEVKQRRAPIRDDTIIDRADTVIRVRGAHAGSVAHDSTSVVHRFADKHEEISRFLDMLERMSFWKAHLFRPDGPIRTPQQLSSVAHPLEDGQELYSTLYTMQLERPQVYSELLEVMKLAVPEFDRLKFPPAGGGLINLAWHQSDFDTPLFPLQLSNGVLRFLWLMTILHTVDDDGLVLLDEPELSLHPQWLMLLVSVLRSMSARTTILVATQSAELVRWCEPDELVVANLTENGSEMVRPRDRGDLDEWLKDFNLGELWTMGELGGRR